MTDVSTTIDPTDLEPRSPIERLAFEIVRNTLAGQSPTPQSRADAERIAAEAGQALLDSGNVAGLEEFVAAFYGALYPDPVEGAETEGALVWSRMGEADKFLTTSNSLQYLSIRADLLSYTYALITPKGDLTSPAELLKERRDQLTGILDKIALARDSLFDRRRSVGADRYRQISAALLISAAEVHMNIADAGFRLRAAAILTDLTEGTAQTNSSASYGAARQAVFEALLLDPDNVRAKYLAAEIEDRLDWLRTGRAFGGARFFEVEPVMGQFDQEEWTPLARMRAVVGRLDALDAGAGAPDPEALETAVKAFTDRLRQSRQRRQDQITQLSREIADLQFRIQQSNLAATSALEANAQVIRDRLVQSETTRADFEARSATLDKDIGEKADELRAALDALAQLTSQGDLYDPGKFNAFATTAKQVMQDTEALVDAVGQFDVKSLQDRARALKTSFDSSMAAGDRSVDILRFEIERLQNVRASVEAAIDSVESAIELARSDYLEEQFRLNVAGLESEVDTLQTEISQVDLNIAEDVEVFATRISKLTFEAFEREKERIQGRIDATKAKIQSAGELIELYKTNKARMEEAVAAAQLAVEAAAAIPSGIIAGTASGTFNQKPQALMTVQELGLKIVDTAQKVEMDIRNAQDIIDDLRGLVDDFRYALDGVELGEMQARLEQDIRDAQAAGKQLEADLQSRIKTAETQITQALKASESRIVARFEQSTAKLSAEKAEFQAQIQSIEAEIKGFEARIAADQRRARALVEEIAVLRGDLGRLTLEKQGIETAMTRAAERTDADVAALQAAADLEAEQFDQLTQPLVRRITLLREMADTLAAGGEARPLDLSISRMTQRSLGPTADALARERLALMDEANELLFQYANWLYLMTRDPVALEWAISAQSPFELKLAMSRLQELYDTLKRTTGLATPRYFVVRLEQEVLNSVYRREDGTLPETLRFSVNPALAPLARKSPQFSNPAGREGVGTHPISVYSPLATFLESDSFGPAPGQAEVVFAPFVESENGAHHLLWDAWVVPRWRDGAPAELSMVGLRPVGPTFYRIGNQVQGHPVLRSRVANYTATSFSYDRLRAQHNLALRFITAGPERSLIDGKLPGMNYRSLLGRGLGNSWELTAPAQWSDLTTQSPGFDALESIDIVFGYLIAPERRDGPTTGPRAVIAQLQQPAPAPRATRRCAPLETRWLCDLRDLQRSNVRAIAQNRRFTSANTETGGAQRGDFRGGSHFAQSPAAVHLRVSALSEMSRSLPAGSGLIDAAPAERPQMPVLAHWTVQPDGSHPVQNAFAQSFCLDGAQASGRSCDARGAIGPPSYADLTTQIVRDEMLAWPETQAAPVGPLELVRVWRSVERLFGSVDPDGQSDPRSGRAGQTLLGETRSAAQNLALVGAQMDRLHDHIAGPLQMARYWVGAYEIARTQIDFVEQFTRALSDTSDVNTAVHEEAEAEVERLRADLETRLRAFHCAEAWFLAAHAAGADNGDPKDLALGAAARMIDAMEPRLEDFLAEDGPPAVDLTSFPFAECQGIFVDAAALLSRQ
ncbi:hypothetical protein RA19_13605 [Leisingera sp. ANG-M1]|nr:hypothetical protein RA19_13605 [Leisingera sp. ANG-M1]